MGYLNKQLNLIYFRREKIAGCAICSENPKITELQDYEKFCGSGPTDKVFF